MNTRTKIIVLAVVALGVIAFVVVRKAPALQTADGLPQVYSNSAMGFSLRLPSDYTAGEAYSYQELGPGKDIPGIKFAIPESVTTGTNLGSDTYISVEEMPQAQSCAANIFIGQGTIAQTMTEGGTAYSIASSTGAAAGNRYEETVYALPNTNPCIAVRYFVHYGVIENYPPGTVREFNKQALLATFDAIRRSMVIGQ